MFQNVKYYYITVYIFDFTETTIMADNVCLQVLLLALRLRKGWMDGWMECNMPAQTCMVVEKV